MPVFAVDTKTGERTWTYRGDNILHTTIAIGPERMYFIDSSITPEERQQLYLQDKGDLKKLTGEAARKAEEEMKKLDLRMAVALDRRTGEKLWEKPVNVTDTTNVSAGGGSLTLMYADGHVVLCGANANGHYWKQFLAGEFEKRKLVVLDASNGKELWSKNANYMNRPAVIGDEIFAEPWAFELHTGEAEDTASSVDRRRQRVAFQSPRASLRHHHCDAQHDVLSQRVHRLLRSVSRQRHTPLCRTASGLLDQRDSRQRFGHDPRSQCGLRLPIFDRVDRGDGTENGKQIVGYLQRRGTDDAGQANGD